MNIILTTCKRTEQIESYGHFLLLGRFGLGGGKKLKRLWIVTLILCVLLMIAYPFRWEKGPTQTEAGLKIIHLRDRWTGQNWITVYGTKTKDGRTQQIGIQEQTFYSGEQFPHFSLPQINKEVDKLLTSPVGQKKKESLQSKIDDAKQEKLIHSKGHTDYVRLYEKVAQQFELEYPPRDGLYANLNRDLERREYALSRIPKDLVESNNSWQAADRKVKQLTKQINDLPNWAKVEAEKSLTKKANRNRNLAAWVWAGLTSITFITTFLLFFRERKSTIPIE